MSASKIPILHRFVTWPLNSLMNLTCLNRQLLSRKSYKWALLLLTESWYRSQVLVKHEKNIWQLYHEIHRKRVRLKKYLNKYSWNLPEYGEAHKPTYPRSWVNPKQDNPKEIKVKTHHHWTLRTKYKNKILKATKIKQYITYSSNNSVFLI